MPYSVSGTKLNTGLEYVASKGLADLTHEGLAPSTTDSQLHANSMSDLDSIGEDVNTPAYDNMMETGLPANPTAGANMPGPAMEKSGGLSRK